MSKGIFLPVFPLPRIETAIEALSQFRSAEQKAGKSAICPQNGN
jgi:hypothetical protein